MYTKEHLNKKRTEKNRYHVQHVYTLQIYTPGSTAGTQGHTVTNVKFASQKRCKEMIEGKKKGSKNRGNDPIPRLRKAMDAKIDNKMVRNPLQSLNWNWKWI
jgi:hypothetical protein